MKERLHTADHILSTILEEKYNTKSTGMTSDENMVSVNLETETDLRAIKDQLEKEVNDIIRKELDVKMYSLSRDEAKKIVDMRFIPDSIKAITIYEIVNFNKIACAGPHVKNTKEIGKFKIIEIKKKGRMRYSLKFTIE